uniref:hypothetical protein n=1 Tax=Microbacterium proteolyticum TaxID=1572644 RepID=UPI0024164E50|nr:hypothetical protein [Microbacterium proteolyticum]
MSVLAEHHVAITIDHSPHPIRLDVSRHTLEMDEEWIPYVQATVECPLGDGGVLVVDPQASDVWATIQTRRLLGRVDRLADFTRRYRGRTLHALSLEFAGQTLAGITRATYHDYTDPGHLRREDARQWRVMLREISADRKAATVTLTLASGEARLNDWQHMSATTDRIPGANLVEKVNFILERCNLPHVTYAPASVPSDAEIGDEALRSPGSSALEFLTGLTRHHGLMLWCDENAQWHLAPDRTRLVTRELRSAGLDRSVINEVSKRSRDDGWITAVMVIYTWEGQDYYDVASPYAPNPEKALILRYNRPYPGPGLAAQILARVLGRGRALELLAVSTYVASPGESVAYITPRETVTGRLAAIRWQFPDDEMSVRLREVGAA